ncbi:MAG: histidinol-phosphatase HisJ family protein [Lachnospiraceae bacterium]
MSKIIGDYHLHTNFSADSDAAMEEMVQRAIHAGLEQLCFTEHMDYDFPEQYALDFHLNTEKYYESLLQMQQRYKDKILLLFGVELGLQPHIAEFYSHYVTEYPFDFVIGSTHLVDRMDPYYPEFFEGRSTFAAYTRYFETLLANLQTYAGFDVLGHLDYVIRYAKDTSYTYTYADFSGLIDEILKTVLHKGIGIELNTSGFKYGLQAPHPSVEVLKRYRELGGEIITVGSDAHHPDYVAASFEKARSLLKDCGFAYYTMFQKRKAEFYPL